MELVDAVRFASLGQTALASITVQTKSKTRTLAVDLVRAMKSSVFRHGIRALTHIR